MSLGSLIAQARKSAGLSIEDLSALTSIRSALLREIESNNFTGCGGETYARGHIRNIAIKLEVDPQVFITAFEEEHVRPDHSLQNLLVENSVMREPQETRKVSWKVLATISVASLFVVVAPIGSLSQNGAPTYAANGMIISASFINGNMSASIRTSPRYTLKFG